jgi:hypothetical protein
VTGASSVNCGADEKNRRDAVRIQQNTLVYGSHHGHEGDYGTPFPFKVPSVSQRTGYRPEVKRKQEKEEERTRHP